MKFYRKKNIISLEVKKTLCIIEKTVTFLLRIKDISLKQKIKENKRRRCKQLDCIPNNRLLVAALRRNMILMDRGALDGFKNWVTKA